MSTTKASEREKQLETQVNDLTVERDDYKSRYESAREAHNDYLAKYEDYLAKYEQAVGERDAAQDAVPLFNDPYHALSEDGFTTVLEIVLGVAHDRGIVTTQEETEATTEAERTEEPSEEAYIKELLQRNGLKTAWLLPDGNPCFSEAHAQHVAGADFDSLTVITAE